MSRKQIDVSKYSEYIKSGVLKHYRHLPETARLLLPLEDCIQDVTLKIHSKLHSYDCKRSSIKTFIYLVTESYFSHLVKASYSHKRTAILIPIEDIKLMLGVGERATSIIKIKEAIDKVRQLHIHCSPALISFLDDNFYSKIIRDRIVINKTDKDYTYIRNPYTKGLRKVYLSKAEILQQRKIEFRQLAERYKVTAEDYRLALSMER